MSKMMGRIAGIVMLFVVCFSVKAQQFTQFSQYMIDGFILNPAYAGTTDYIPIRMSNRNQWLGFEGSPRSYFLSAHTNLDDNNGLGAIIYTESEGPSSHTGLMFSYAYRFPLNYEYSLSFGLSTNLYANNFNNDLVNIIDPNDPAFAGADETSFSGDVNFGVYLFSDEFYLSFSVPHLIESPNKLGTEIGNEYKRHYFLSSGYYISTAYKGHWGVEPSFMLKTTETSNPQLDINARVLYQDYLFGGISYRIEDATSIMVGIKTKRFLVSYSYDIGLSDISDHHNGTHEFVLGFNIDYTNSTRNNRWWDRHKIKEWDDGKGAFKR